MPVQNTLKSAFKWSGPGLHTGRLTTVRLLPAAENSGIRFRRIDLDGQPEIPAHINSLHSTDRSTNLANGTARVHTVEHLLSALAAARIDNALIEIDGPEVPILDGSAQPFVAGIEPEAQAAEREVFVLKKSIRYDNGRGTRIEAHPADELILESTIDFGQPPIGRQTATLTDLNDFATEISRARTFCFLDEIELLYDHGLIRGGDISNAVVFVREEMPELEVERIAQKIGKPDLYARDSGTLTNTELRYPDEPGRHKLLDLLGDITLLGCPVQARIVAVRPGHAANAAFTKLLYDQLQSDRSS